MKLLLCVAIFTASCLGYDPRFRNLRTNRDGSAVYFVSDMRLAGTDSPFHSKVFLVTEKGLETLLSFPRAAISGFDVSQDGETIAYTLDALCDAVEPCFVSQPSRAVIRRRAGPVLWEGDGRAWLSPDGRFAVVVQSSGIYRIDLAAQSRRLLVSGATAGIAASAGGLVLVQFVRPQAHLFRDGDWETMQTVLGSTALLSGDASTLVYRAAGETDFVARKLSSGSAVSVPGVPVSVNGDGSRVLTRITSPAPVRPQLRVYDVASSRAFVIPEDIDPYSDILLTPDGKTVIGANGKAIWKVDVESELARPFVIAPIRLLQPVDYAVPGSMASAVVRDVLQATTVSANPPLPESLSGLRIFVDGRAAPIRSLTVEDTEVKVQFQVPWETALTRDRVRVVVESSQVTLFEGLGEADLPPNSTQMQLRRRMPQLLRRTGAVVQALHQDLDRPVTLEDPARPGEVVHFFVTGLGRVNREVATGAASPAEPPARPLEPLNCLGVPVLDTVLAPGEVGIYRATIAIPQFAVNFLNLNCEGSTGMFPVVSRP